MSNRQLDVSGLGLGEVDFMFDSHFFFTLEILDRETPRWPDQPPVAGEFSDFTAAPAESSDHGNEGSGFTIAKWIGALGVAFLLHPGLRRR